MVMIIIQAYGALVVLLLMFATISGICDKHLIPCVEVFIKRYKIPEEVAAVTLVAFGNACPELLLNSVGALRNESDLSLPAILGSGMIAFGLIPSLSLLCNTPIEQKLLIRPMLREVLFYVSGLFIFLFGIQDGIVDFTDALLLTSIYIFYVTSVLWANYIGTDFFKHRQINLNVETSNNPIDSQFKIESLVEKESKDVTSFLKDNKSNMQEEKQEEEEIDDGDEEKDDIIAKKEDEQPLLPSYSQFQLNSNEAPNLLSDSSHNWRDKLLMMVLRVWTKSSEYIQYILQQIIPVMKHQSVSDDTRISVWRAFMILFVCIVYLAVSTYGIILVCTNFIELAGLDSSTVGATLIALGSEIPDCISSITMAKYGYFNGAIASVIGSQVINVSLGVGISSIAAISFQQSLLQSNDGNKINYGVQITSKEQESLWLLATMLMMIIFSFILTIMPITQSCFQCTIPKTAIFSRVGAKSIICIWLILYVVFIIHNEVNITTITIPYNLQNKSVTSFIN